MLNMHILSALKRSRALAQLQSRNISNNPHNMRIIGAKCAYYRLNMLKLHKNPSKTDRVSIGNNTPIKVPIETLSVLEHF